MGTVVVIYIINSFMSMSKGKEVAKFVCCIVFVVKFLLNCQHQRRNSKMPWQLLFLKWNGHIVHMLINWLLEGYNCQNNIPGFVYGVFGVEEKL